MKQYFCSLSFRFSRNFNAIYLNKKIQNYITFEILSFSEKKIALIFKKIFSSCFFFAFAKSFEILSKSFSPLKVWYIFFERLCSCFKTLMACSISFVFCGFFPTSFSLSFCISFSIFWVCFSNSFLLFLSFMISSKFLSFVFGSFFMRTLNKFSFILKINFTRGNCLNFVFYRIYLVYELVFVVFEVEGNVMRSLVSYLPTASVCIWYRSRMFIPKWRIVAFCGTSLNKWKVVIYVFGIFVVFPIYFLFQITFLLYLEKKFGLDFTTPELFKYLSLISLASFSFLSQECSINFASGLGVGLLSFRKSIKELMFFFSEL